MTDTLARPAAALADRYRLEREVGAGGMATVFLALDLKHERRVALKLLRPELAAAIGSDQNRRDLTMFGSVLDDPRYQRLIEELRPAE